MKNLRLLGPAIFSNLYVLYTVFVLNGGISDVLFWFWLDFVVSFLFLLPLVESFFKHNAGMAPGLASRERPLLFFAFMLFFLYITIFLAVSYRGEWGSYDRLPLFLAGKSWGIMLLSLLGAFTLVSEYRRGKYLDGSYNDLTRGFTEKAVVICIIYLVMQIEYHWVKGTFDAGRGTLALMILAFVAAKMAAEAGLFGIDSILPLRDRLMKRYRR